MAPRPDTRPGTNFIQIPPEHRKKVKPLVKYYRTKPHPFRACVRDNTKRFGPRVNQVCAVVTDMVHGSTHWRKGGKKHLSAQGVPTTIDLSASTIARDLVGLYDELAAKKSPTVIDLAEWDGKS
jgi:hypothetical protein